jgi:hypothetical protein
MSREQEPPGDPSRTGRVLGLSISAGTLYAGLVECPDVPVFTDSFERLDLAVGLEGAAQLSDLSARFKQEIRRIEPTAVGVLNTRKYSNWKYADVFRRVCIEAVVMLAVTDLSSSARTMRYVLLKQEGLPKALGIPAGTFAEGIVSRWGPGMKRYAKDRAWAFATATALAKQECR